MVEFYRRNASDRPAIAAMARLAEQLAESPYSTGLHPMTSHFLLRLFAQDGWDVLEDHIQVTHDGEVFVVHYVSQGRVHPCAATPTEVAL